MEKEWKVLRVLWKSPQHGGEEHYPRDIIPQRLADHLNEIGVRPGEILPFAEVRHGLGSRHPQGPPDNYVGCDILDFLVFTDREVSELEYHGECPVRSRR